MRAALIGAVDCNEAHLARTLFDYVVAVDRGWETCNRAGVAVDFAVGDFDSLGSVPQGVPVATYPSRKDESDMELALAHVFERGATEAFVYGALSQRLDHTLANLQVMGAYAARGMKTFGIGSDFAAVALAASAHGGQDGAGVIAFSPFDPGILTGSYAPHLSLFALNGPAAGVCISGLAYEMREGELTGLSTRGLSNEFTGKVARIEVGEGCLLAIMPLEALDHIAS